LRFRDIAHRTSPRRMGIIAAQWLARP